MQKAQISHVCNSDVVSLHTEGTFTFFKALIMFCLPAYQPGKACEIVRQAITGNSLSKFPESSDSKISGILMEFQSITLETLLYMYKLISLLQRGFMVYSYSPDDFCTGS